MEVLNFIFICFVYFFVASILMGIVEVIINYTDNEAKSEKVRRIYFIVFFVILLFIVNGIIKNDERLFQKKLDEKEKYVTDIIEDAESLKDLKRTWENRDW